MPHQDRNADDELFAAFSEFVESQTSSAVAAFADRLRDWGSEWVPVEPRHGAACDQIVHTIDSTVAPARALVHLLVEHRNSRAWEQTYSHSDGVVGDDMLASYGFAELVGPLGPFVSTRIRGGIGVYGPNVTYPLHRHGPDEIYILLSGSAEFTVGEHTKQELPGGVIHVPSDTHHGFVTGDSALVVLYLWQNGELRETSTFV